MSTAEGGRIDIVSPDKAVAYDVGLDVFVPAPIPKPRSDDYCFSIPIACIQPIPVDKPIKRSNNSE